uniref:Putative secreted protein n=1 Tax=Ixodes ricinus TaxID=34613 RepID=A0A6B0UH50_IXORI
MWRWGWRRCVPTASCPGLARRCTAGPGAVAGCRCSRRSSSCPWGSRVGCCPRAEVRTSPSGHPRQSPAWWPCWRTASTGPAPRADSRPPPWFRWSSPGSGDRR